MYRDRGGEVTAVVVNISMCVLGVLVLAPVHLGPVGGGIEIWVVGGPFGQDSKANFFPLGGGLLPCLWDPSAPWHPSHNWYGAPVCALVLWRQIAIDGTVVDRTVLCGRSHACELTHWDCCPGLLKLTQNFRKLILKNTVKYLLVEAIACARWVKSIR